MAKKLKTTVFRKLEKLFQNMEGRYDEVAGEIGLSCEGCEDNCCTSYFQHHTYVEWAFLWKGMMKLPEDTRGNFLERAREYVEQSRMLLSQGIRPSIMCPLNEEGKCRLYTHRLMICRMHGVPNQLRLPGGEVKTFPGCFKSQELRQSLERVPFVDRTEYYQALAKLEMEFAGPRLRSLPKVDLTLAEMLVQGAPRI